MFIRSNEAGQDLLNIPLHESKFNESRLLISRFRSERRSDENKSTVTKRFTTVKNKVTLNAATVVKLSGLRLKEHHREMTAAKENF